MSEYTPFSETGSSRDPALLTNLNVTFKGEETFLKFTDLRSRPELEQRRSHWKGNLEEA